MSGTGEGWDRAAPPEASGGECQQHNVLPFGGVTGGALPPSFPPPAVPGPVFLAQGSEQNQL